MIELKIANATAVKLITERMKRELEQQIKVGRFHPETTIFTLKFDDLFQLAESSAVDLICFLPATVHFENNNLAVIINKAMQSLSIIFNQPDFNDYTEERAQKLITPIKMLFTQSETDDSFLRN